MGLLKVIMGLFKRIGKLFGGKKKQGDPNKGSDEKRIAIYGPSAVGKTVFFTMLVNETKGYRPFNMSAADDTGATAELTESYFHTLENGEWLSGTLESVELKFNVTSDRIGGKKGFPFSTQDYRGETIEESGEEVARLLDWMAGADAILFLVSPDLILDKKRCGLAVSRFQGLINQVKARTGGVLQAPVGLMVTKADQLDGFNSKRQVELFQRKSEYLKSKSFDDMLEGALAQPHLKDDLVFGRSVREVMTNLKSLFVFLSNLTLEYQVFFVSAVGRVQAAGEGVKPPPPSPLNPIGVVEPFRWVVDTLKLKERIARTRAFRSLVSTVCVVLFLFYAIPYAIHLLPPWAAIQPQLLANDEVRDAGGSTMLDTGQLVDDSAGYADGIGVKIVSILSIPWTDANLTQERAARRAGLMKAYQFAAEFRERVSDQDLRNRVAAWENPDLAPQGFDEDLWDALPDAAQDELEAVYSKRVLAFNRDLVRRARALNDEQNCEAMAGLEDEVIAWEGATKDVKEAIDRQQQEIGDLIALCGISAACGGSVDAVRTLADEFRALCETGEIEGALGDMTDQLEEAEEALVENCEDERDFQITVEGWRDFVDEMTSGLRRLDRAALPVDTDRALCERQLRDIRAALRPARTYLRTLDQNVQPSAYGAVDAFVEFADRLESQARSCIAGNLCERDDGIADELDAQLGEEPWEVLSGRVSRWLNGHSRKSTLEGTISKWVEENSASGIEINLGLASNEAAQSYVVQWRDFGLGGVWDDNMVNAASRVDTRWYPNAGYEVRVLGFDSGGDTVEREAAEVPVRALVEGRFEISVEGQPLILEFGGTAADAIGDLVDDVVAAAGCDD